MFSATATLSAFIVPVHIWALMNGFAMRTDLLIFKLYFLLLFAVLLYHSFYRLHVICFDLTWIKTAHWVWRLTILLYPAAMLVVLMRLF